MGGLLKRLGEGGATTYPADGIRSFTERMMLDGGSNCTFSFRRQLFDIGARSPSAGSIGGIASGLQYTHIVTAGATFEGAQQRPNVNMSLLFTPKGGKNIISESILLDEYGIEVNKKKMACIHPCGTHTPVWRERGLFFADITFSAPLSDERPPAIASAAEVKPEAGAAVSAHDKALLWSARLGVGGEGFVKVLKAVKGIGIDRVSNKLKEVIDSRTDRAIAQAKHGPSHSTPIAKLATKPGLVLICDGFGKHHAASPIDSATYQFHAVDEYSSYGFIASGKTHTIDDWMDFLRAVTLEAKKYGHTVERVRFDRAPELRSDELKQRAAKELNILVELTAREHHEGVGRAERNNDLLTRMAEEMLQRAKLGTAWLLVARAYAQWLLNRTPLTRTGETRYQRFRAEVPDFATGLTPYIFGTTVAVVEDVKGPKGSLDHPRGSIGRFVGVADSAYLVWRDVRKNVVHQASVRTLNEQALITSSLPPCVAGVTVEVQTEGDARVDTELGPDEPPFAERGDDEAAEAAPKPAKHPVVNVPTGSRIEALWQDHLGEWAWWAGTVLSSYEQKDGKRRHTVHHEGWGEWQYDLADQGAKEWRYLDQQAQLPPQTSDGAGRVTRSKAGVRDHVALQAACRMVDASLEATPCLFGKEGERLQCEAFNAAVYQALGDDGANFECDKPSDIERARTLLGMAAVSRHEPTVRVFDVQRAEACKATQNVVDVVTDIGTQQFIVPASFKKAAQGEQACEWLEADRKALDAILMYPGNRLVPLSVPGNAGLPIARCVSQRKIKVDAATGRLESRNSFKSRHCVDGGHLKMLLARQGIGTTSDASSSVADEMLVKLLLADVALRDRTLLKADVPNAYPQGKRTGRPLTYMYMPEAFRDMRSDDGEQLCIELATPMWGERQAGFEWQLELERTLESLGWRRAENVPACWRYKGAEGDATLITIVDDMLFSESRESNYSISERTVAKLSALYGDLRPGRAPDSFAGYSIDRTAGRIRISLPQKLIQAAREHLPGLLDTATDDERKVVANLPSCKKLEAMADAMVMPERRKSGLTPLQRSTQALIGSLKFIERCHPRASLMLHRLSCVMTCPPPEAYTVARALLNSLYAERDVGITYGRNGVPERGDEYELKGQLSSNIVDLNGVAPMELEAMADATWGDRNVYGLLITFAGGAVYHVTKKIALIVDSSMETEAIASAKAGEQVEVAREVLRAFGIAPTRPTLIGTDNLANFKVATGIGCPSRSRHFLRRYFVLKRRIASGDVTMLHVPDVQMPADCLTKWLGRDKIRASVEYMTGKRVAATAGASIAVELGNINEAIACLTDHNDQQSDNLIDQTIAVGGSVVGQCARGASVTEPTSVTRVVGRARSRPAQEGAARRPRP